MNKFPIFLSSRLKTKRQELGFTLDALAKQVGCSKSFLWEIENRPQTDAANPSGCLVFHLSRTLGVRMEYFYDVCDGETYAAEIGARVMQAVFHHLDLDKVALAMGYEKRIG